MRRPLSPSYRFLNPLPLLLFPTFSFSFCRRVIRYGPGGEAWFCCFLNSLIHVFMYGYYLLSTVAGKEGNFRRILNRLKPGITIGQMTQFLLFIAQGGYLLYTDCFKPRIQPVLLVFQCVIFFVLFANFAIQTYVLKPKKSSERRTKKE